MSAEELISIITPAYNAARFIDETIRSVQDQSHRNWEMLIVDDCSKDNTRALLESYAASDPRIRPIFQERNGGPARARNAALRAARSPLVAYLDSDDLWLPDKLARQLSFMRTQRHAFTFTGFRRITADGSKVGRYRKLVPRLRYNDLLKDTSIMTSTVMIDRAVTGDFEMPVTFYDDFATWLLILKRGHVAYGLDEDLTRYRVVGASVSRNKLEVGKHGLACIPERRAPVVATLRVVLHELCVSRMVQVPRSLEHMLALVTGGNGFVARHLVALLAQRGHGVCATFRGPSPPSSTPSIHWVRIDDVGPRTDWREALENVDVVFHLAGVAHRIQASQGELADEYHRVNVLGTEQLARSAIEQARPMRMVFMSSIGAVCTTSDAVVTSATPPHPDSIYGQSKLRAEQLLEQVCQDTALQWCALRAPLVYGPGAPGNLPRLAALASRGWPLPLGKASAPRSFAYVGNLCDALLAAAQAPDANSRCLLVADAETTSVVQLLRSIASLRGHRSLLLPMPRGAMRFAAGVVDLLRNTGADRNDSLARAVDLLFGSLVIDTGETRRLLGWQPPFTLQEALAATFHAPPRRAAA